MFLNYEVVATFGVSAVVSFFVSAILLLMYVAKKGMLRIGSRKKAVATLLPQEHMPKILTPVELMPLKEHKVAL